MRSARPTSASAVSTRSRRSRARQRRQQQRQLDVLERGQHRHQVVELEDEADVRGAPVGELASRQARDVDAADARASRRSGLSMPAIRLSSVRLARARRPHQRDEVARARRRGDVDQHRDDLVAAPVGLGEMRIATSDAASARRLDPARMRRRAAMRVALLRRRPSRAHPFASLPAGFSTTLSPAFTSPATAVRSPIFAPGVTGTRDRLVVAHDEHDASCRRAATIASALHRGQRLLLLGASRPATGSDTLALMSGRTRGSISSKRTLIITVALARSTVGTMRLTRAAKAHVGQRVELDLAGLPDLDLRQARLGDVGLDFERAHVGHRHHRALGVRGATRTA